MRIGNLFVISGPSGAGKGTLVARLLSEVPDAWVSVSATTRVPREGEIDGVHYYFKSVDEFARLVDEDGFLEWARYAENCYGTPRKSVEEHLARGEQVVLEIDVQGAFQVRERFRKRIRVHRAAFDGRTREASSFAGGTETDEVVQARLAAAKLELSRKMEYDIRFVNDNIDQATAELVDYVNQCAENQ